MLGSAAFRTGIAPGGALAGPWVRNPLWTSARAVPSLDLNFADNKSLVDATTGASLVTFTRASTGTYVGSDGLIKTATTNEARFDHNPTTGESLGLLVEEARTNLLLRSEEFNDAYWTTSVLITSNSTTSPDGVLTADLLADTVDASAQAHQVSKILSVTSGVAYTLSAYIKAGTGIGFSLGASAAGAFTVEQRVVFNAVTGVATLSLGTPTNISITPTGSGWYRCSCVITPTTTGNATIVLRLYNSAGAGFYQGDGTQNAYLWGAQLEAGAFATSYIPTTSATVTRAADVASITGSNFSSWANNNEGTIFSDSSIIASQIKTQAVWELSGGIALSSLRQPQGTANQFRAVIGGTFTGSPGTGASLTTGVTLAAVAYSATAGRLQIGIVGTDTTGSTLDATSLSIGSLAGASQLNGRIKRLCFWPARLPDATLQQITQ